MEQKQSIFKKLTEGLGKTRNGPLLGLFSSKREINDDFFDELEEALVIADTGMAVTLELLDELKRVIKERRITHSDDAREALIELIAEKMQFEQEFLSEKECAVLLVVGVNGVGKTTTIGKLAHFYKQMGESVMLAAADTFRAAASEQLTIWAQRNGVPIVKHGEGSDPAAVLFDAISSFKAKGGTKLICDTAGRLHNKKNLMNELEKMRRIIDREMPDITTKVLLVLDAAAGQNSLIQARTFMEFTGVTDVVLTKLDGTAKGGMAIAVKSELNLPVRFIGIGEGIDDLQPFDAEAYARALIG